MHEVHEGNHVLYDNCFQCREHAHNPFDLDDGTFQRIVRLADLNIQYGDRQPDGTFYSEAEVLATREVKFVRKRARRIKEAQWTPDPITGGVSNGTS